MRSHSRARARARARTVTRSHGPGTHPPLTVSLSLSPFLPCSPPARLPPVPPALSFRTSQPNAYLGRSGTWPGTWHCLQLQLELQHGQETRAETRTPGLVSRREPVSSWRANGLHSGHGHNHRPGRWSGPGTTREKKTSERRGDIVYKGNLANTHFHIRISVMHTRTATTRLQTPREIRCPCPLFGPGALPGARTPCGGPVEHGHRMAPRPSTTAHGRPTDGP
ncbi:hypothetical protein BKA56DRAFT_298445 [Ilyonectria sp. MPI-CAGE-AT-0026]|nr:hypothetical protein BKA56DRAFT_298445 [Ilyonectria sp. MPI-CAGE-AT-0026]